MRELLTEYLRQQMAQLLVRSSPDLRVAVFEALQRVLASPELRADPSCLEAEIRQAVKEAIAKRAPAVDERTPHEAKQSTASEGESS